jgi:sigma-E factor negative regulatory protein RseC
MLTETGTVFRVDGDSAWIRIPRKSACTKCHGCMHEEDGSTMITDAVNMRGTSVGDVVRIECPSRIGAVGAGLILYLLPVVALIGGYAAGGAIAGALGVTRGGELPGILSGFFFMGLVFFGVYAGTHWGKNRERRRFRVVAIVKRNNPAEH